jgi:hypothetical protein
MSGHTREGDAIERFEEVDLGEYINVFGAQTLATFGRRRFMGASQRVSRRKWTERHAARLSAW